MYSARITSLPRIRLIHTGSIAADAAARRCRRHSRSIIYLGKPINSLHRQTNQQSESANYSITYIGGIAACGASKSSRGGRARPRLLHGGRVAHTRAPGSIHAHMSQLIFWMLEFKQRRRLCSPAPAPRRPCRARAAPPRAAARPRAAPAPPAPAAAPGSGPAIIIIIIIIIITFTFIIIIIIDDDKAARPLNHVVITDD